MIPTTSWLRVILIIFSSRLSVFGGCFIHLFRFVLVKNETKRSLSPIGVSNRDSFPANRGGRNTPVSVLQKAVGLGNGYVGIGAGIRGYSVQPPPPRVV